MEESCPAGTSLELRCRDVPAPDNKSLGCCCRNSLPTVINPLNNDRNWGINFYSIMMKPNYWWINKYCQFKCSNLSQNCPWLQHGYMCTSWGHVTLLFLSGNTCSNHCDVTVRFVTLNSNCTLNQNRQQNIHYHSWETDQNQSNYFDKMIFWKYKLFTMV